MALRQSVIFYPTEVNPYPADDSNAWNRIQSRLNNSKETNWNVTLLAEVKAIVIASQSHMGAKFQVFMLLLPPFGLTTSDYVGQCWQLFYWIRDLENVDWLIDWCFTARQHKTGQFVLIYQGGLLAQATLWRWDYIAIGLCNKSWDMLCSCGTHVDQLYVTFINRTKVKQVGCIPLDPPLRLQLFYTRAKLINTFI